MDDAETLRLLADHMEGGFLENIVGMFRHDSSLHRHLAGLMADERGRVRLGAVALAEELSEEHGQELRAQVPALGGLLGHGDPTIRADAAYLLGVIGSPDALPYLEAALREEEAGPVLDLMEETVRELRGRSR